MGAEFLLGAARSLVAIATIQTGRRDLLVNAGPPGCRKIINARRLPQDRLAAVGPLAGHYQPTDHDGGQRGKPNYQRPVHRRISGTKSGHRDGIGLNYFQCWRHKSGLDQH